MGNLSRSTIEEELEGLFGEYGTIQSCDVEFDSAQGATRGLAFVETPKPG
ncbi:MAG: hypothetical protein LJE92_06795 [Gammaproteobacteria bacterium]|nr:hypothetical protein [Gammaproteobacteria bacterium]